ncbi:MAG: hypothetical protein EAZ11_06765 [Curvibacter sp.]|nr:MAG: hypothetical protein EAZ11_06765 [Curvibacter sp.]
MSAPALPSLWLMQLWLPLGWAVVLAAVVVLVCTRFTQHRGVVWGLPLLIALWTLLPGEVSPAYWLGLAFQAPSILLVLLCACAAWRALQGGTVMAHPGKPVVTLALVAVVLGWLLLLDTLAQLPVALYALGFNAPVLAVVAFVTLLPLLQANAAKRVSAWLLPLAVLLYVMLRLPTGNVWDAMLDPWLWLGLHGYLLRVVLKRA